MENYDILLNQIKEFLKQEKVTSENTNNQVISMYDLYKSVNDELKGLKNLLTIESKLKKKLNNFLYFVYPWRSVKNDKFFCGTESEVKLYGTIDVSSIIFKAMDYEISINKDKNIDDIYLSKKSSDENKSICKFVKKNYCLIIEILSKIEEYSDLVGGISTTTEEKIMNFSNNLFVGTLSYDNSGKVNLNINIEPNHPLASEYSKNWYSKQSIYDFVNENIEEILKRIPVSNYEINNNFIKIYDRYKETEKEKQLAKSIRWWN